jgi:hypothetical protein
VSGAQVLDAAMQCRASGMQADPSRRHLMTASSLVFVVALLVTLVVLRRRLRRQIRRNELSMTYIPW